VSRNKVVRAVFGRNSKLVVIQIVLLVLGIFMAYEVITHIAGSSGPSPVSKE
jgi:hypothetical protein